MTDLDGFDSLGDHDGSDGVGAAMRALSRGVETSVVIPPFSVVTRRHARRVRRRAAGLGVAAAVVLAAAITPVALNHHAANKNLATLIAAQAPLSGPLQLDDVSFTDDSNGVALAHQCTGADCTAVVSATSDGGATWGADQKLPAAADVSKIAAHTDELYAYSPDLYVSSGNGRWSALDAPAAVADIAESTTEVWVLLTPTGQQAELWTGPLGATSWAQFTETRSVPNTDDTARLQRPGPGTNTVVVTDSGTATTVGALEVSTDAGTTWNPVALPAGCAGTGWQRSLATVDTTHWWLLCSAPGRTSAVYLGGPSGRWVTKASPPAGSQNAVTAINDEDVYLSGPGAALLRSRNDGLSWTVALADTTGAGFGQPHFPGGISGKQGWLAALGTTTVWQTSDGGESWSAGPLGTAR